MKAKRMVSKFSAHSGLRLSCTPVAIFFFWCNKICNVGHFQLLLKKTKEKSYRYWVIIR
uniref:Uncharacterized protein n=1 Tax=Arundo donax TaxID=35708 RepID=A0A0A9CM24_ARUDO